MSPDFYLQPLKIMTLKEFQLEMDKVTVTASHAKVGLISTLAASHEISKKLACYMAEAILVSRLIGLIS